jgi:hypothetical protein
MTVNQTLILQKGTNKLLPMSAIGNTMEVPRIRISLQDKLGLRSLVQLELLLMQKFCDFRILLTFLLNLLCGKRSNFCLGFKVIYDRCKPLFFFLKNTSCMPCPSTEVFAYGTYLIIPPLHRRQPHNRPFPYFFTMVWKPSRFNQPSLNLNRRLDGGLATKLHETTNRRYARDALTVCCFVCIVVAFLNLHLLSSSSL